VTGGRLVAGADAVFANFKPGMLAGLGFSHESLRPIGRPRLHSAGHKARLVAWLSMSGLPAKVGTRSQTNGEHERRVCLVQSPHVSKCRPMPGASWPHPARHTLHAATVVSMRKLPGMSLSRFERDLSDQ
jgi:hypothetical protein